MKKAFLVLVFLAVCGNAFAAELLIKRSDSDGERAYKRGDIVEVMPDGWYADKPHLTVLAVPGLDHTKITKLMEPRKELIDTQVTLSPEEFAVVKDMVETITVNDKTYTIYLGKYVNPSLVSNIDGVRTYSAKVIETYQRRRFQIPSAIMNNIFPSGVYRVEVSREVFLGRVKKIFDKSFNQAIENTTWKDALLNAITQ